MDSHLLYKPSEDTATITTTLFIHCRVLQFVNEFGDFFGGLKLFKSRVNTRGGGLEPRDLTLAFF